MMINAALAEDGVHSGSAFAERCIYRLFSGLLLLVFHKSGSDLEKRRFLLENDEKASLLLEIGMIILYLLKVSSFGIFGCKNRLFPVEMEAFFTFFDFNQLGRLFEAALGSK